MAIDNVKKENNAYMMTLAILAKEVGRIASNLLFTFMNNIQFTKSLLQPNG